MSILDLKGKAIAAGAGLLVGLVGCGVLGGMLWAARADLTDSRQTIERQGEAIRTRDASIIALRGNVATLGLSLTEQSKTIADAAEAGAERQKQAAAALAQAGARLRDAEARITALRAIQASGDRTQGANYAFDVRRARAGR